MRKTLTALLLCAASTALAGPRDPEWNPPAAYDHPYRGELHLHRVPVGQVDEACIALYTREGKPASWRWEVTASQHGCAVRKATSCEVIIPLGPIMRAPPSAILRHEVGHCNGWVHE